MKPFNLREALAGQPVITRKGDKAFILNNLNDLKDKGFTPTYPLVGIIQNKTEVFCWTLEGRISLHTDEALGDIVGMWEEPTPTVTLKLPCPPENVEDRKFGIFISDVYCRRLTKDIYFAKREDIEEWVRALSNLLTIKKEQEIKELENATTN